MGFTPKKTEQFDMLSPILTAIMADVNSVAWCYEFYYIELLHADTQGQNEVQGSHKVSTLVLDCWLPSWDLALPICQFLQP